jgi:glycosyltransferase involved in cell wall biosynthesis
VRTVANGVRRVGLNAHLLSLTQTYRGAGINNYAHQLLRHLPATAQIGEPELAYEAYLYDRNFAPPPGLAVRRSRWDTRSPWRRIAWEQTRLAALSGRLDLLHGLAYVAPLAAVCPTVVTIHDLSFIRLPETFRPGNRLYLTLVTRLSVRRAARVIADSESTRQDVLALCAAPAERVVTIPIGVGPEFSPAPQAEVAEWRRRQGLPDRYLLYLGTIEPRKNLVRLVEAYAQLRSADAATPPLVIAGAAGWYYEQVFARVEALGLGDVVSFPGYVPEAEKPWWYRAADLFVYPSLFEGFGLPVLEALACATPVVTTAVSSLPEVAGSAAVLVEEPDKPAALAQALAAVLTDCSLADRLRQAGPAQAARFTWTATAAATTAVYRAVLGGKIPLKTVQCANPKDG